MDHDCAYSLKVLDGKVVRSSLIQGGLEIKCSVTANWGSDDGIDILKSSIQKNYNLDDRLVDDLKSVLESLTYSYEVEEDIEMEYEFWTGSFRNLLD